METCSLAGELVVKAAEDNGEGLQGAHGVAEVHGEDVLRHPAELQDNVLHCRQTGTVT